MCLYSKAEKYIQLSVLKFGSKFVSNFARE